MKKFILFALVSFLMMDCTAHNGNDMAMQYKAVALYEENDTAMV